MKSWIPQNYNFGQLDHTIEFIDSFWFWVNPCHTIQKGIIPILFLSPYYSYLNSNVFSAFTCMIWLTFWERWEFSCRLKLMNKLFFYMIQQSIWFFFQSVAVDSFTWENPSMNKLNWFNSWLRWFDEIYTFHHIDNTFLKNMFLILLSHGVSINFFLLNIFSFFS